MDSFEQIDGSFTGGIDGSLHVYSRRSTMVIGSGSSSGDAEHCVEDPLLEEVERLRPFPLYVDEAMPVGETDYYLSPEVSFGPLNAKPDVGWLKVARKNDYPRVGRELYALPPEYELVVPADDAHITAPPPGHIGLYSYHLDFGLRFPLDPTLVKFLKAFNVSLAQLHPFAMWTLVCYLWVVRFKGIPETLSL